MCYSWHHHNHGALTGCFTLEKLKIPYHTFIPLTFTGEKTVLQIYKYKGNSRGKISFLRPLTLSSKRSAITDVFAFFFFLPVCHLNPISYLWSIPHCVNLGRKQKSPRPHYKSLKQARHFLSCPVLWHVGYKYVIQVQPHQRLLPKIQNLERHPQTIHGDRGTSSEEALVQTQQQCSCGWMGLRCSCLPWFLPASQAEFASFPVHSVHYPMTFSQFATKT